MRYRELLKKEVVNICDGRFLGFVTDFEFDECDWRIQVLFVKRPPQGIHKYFPWLFHEEEQAIVVSRIAQVGEDVILVEEIG